MVSDYHTLLEDIRRLREGSLSATQSSYKSVVEELVSVYEAQLDLNKQSRKLTTRLKSHQDRQEDFEAWRRVSSVAAEVNAEALNAYHVYSVTQFRDETDQLWASLRARFEAQPLSFLSSSQAVSKEIEAQNQRITRWLENRREDFDAQCQAYQQLLASASIEAVLRVPFDKERPTESQNALMIRVKEYLDRHFNVLHVVLKNALQVIRYGIQVQGLSLSDAEHQAREALRIAAKVKEEIHVEVISDQQRFKEDVLKPLIALAEAEKKLAEEVQRSVQQRPAEGTELRLMELFQTSGTGQEVDLRELIIRLIDRGEATVNLGALMRDVESLFQKNLVDIQIKLSRSELS